MGDKIVIASDHRGAGLKAALRKRLESEGHPVVDLGTQGDASVDYPDFAAPAARAVSQGEVPRGIVICGSGLGVSYTANRFPRVRAALVHDVESAALARQHNDANVLALSGDRTDPETAWKIGGVVPITRSTSRTRNAVHTELNMKLKKERIRHT